MAIQAVTDRDFEERVLKAEGTIVVDFWAPWCGPCKALAPVLEAAAEHYEGRLTFYKLNTQANPRVPGALGIRSIPTLVIFRDGEPVDVAIGAQSPLALRAMLDRAARGPGLFSRLARALRRHKDESASSSESAAN